MVLQHSTRVTNILGQNPDNAQPLDANAQQPDGENQADQSTLLQHLTDHSNEKAVLNILTKALTASNNKNRKHKFLAAGYGGAMTILAAIIPIIVQHYAK